MELMLATVILAGVALGGVGAFQFITKGIRQSRTKTIAANIVQEKMEVLKNYSYFQLLVSSDTGQDNNYSPPVVYDESNYPPEDILLWGFPAFKRVVHVAYADMSGASISTVSYSSSDTGIKQIIVSILWQEDDRYKKVELRNLLANPAAASLNSSFAGTVRIQGTLAPLAGAVVQVSGSPNYKATTASDGTYSFEVAKGSYSLTCSSAGFYTSIRNGLQALQGIPTTGVDFTLPVIGSGTVSGSVWISSYIVISQMVASSGTQGGFEVEYVELYNPTSYAWTIDSSNLELVYREKNTGGAAVTIPLTFDVTTLPSLGFYLISSTSPVTVSGVTRYADARFTVPVPAGLIVDVSDGGIGIRKDAVSPFYDRIAWAKSGGPDPPLDFRETSAITLAGGLGDDQALVRLTTPGLSPDPALGNAYDTDINLRNFEQRAPVALPRNTSVTLPSISGAPAHGALVSSSDGRSAPVQAQASNMDTASESAIFSLPGVTTGTWTVTITSGAYKLIVSGVVVTQGAVTYIPNAATTPAWPDSGDYSSILVSTTSGGYVQGYVYRSGADYWTPLSGILVEANGVQGRTASNGYYYLNVDTGTVTVNANFNQDDTTYTTDSAVGTVDAGQLSVIAPDPYFHLSRAGTITGYVTSGTGALPNIVVKAALGVQTFEATTDTVGRFFIDASTSASAYTLSPVLDPLQTYTAAPADPLTVTLTAPGSTVFAGTFTVTGGLGRIAGSVKDAGANITTGVLLIASTGTITDPPPVIYGSSAPALSTPYYATSSQADGTFWLEVRGGTYTMRAYYPVVSVHSGSVTFTNKTKSAVVVNAGQTTSSVNFTWP